MFRPPFEWLIVSRSVSCQLYSGALLPLLAPPSEPSLGGEWGRAESPPSGVLRSRARSSWSWTGMEKTLLTPSSRT